MNRKLERARVHVLVGDEGLMGLITAMLAREGATVSSCSTVHALEWISSGAIASVDVAVIDPDAEQGAGLAAAVALQAARPERCPWVAITRGGDPLRRRAAQLSGAMSSVEVSQNLDTLADAVRDCLPAAPLQRVTTAAPQPTWPGIEGDLTRVARLLLDGEPNKGIAQTLAWELGRVSRAVAKLMAITDVVPRTRRALATELRRRLRGS